MARIPTREFNPAVPVIVRRFFAAAGRHWNPGDTFDWQRLSVAQRRVKQMFDAGKLMHPEDVKSDWTGLQAREGAAAAPAPVVSPEPTVETEVQDEDVLAAAAEPSDELDDLDMKALREIAVAEDAPTRVSREAQREAIRENRKAKADD